MTDEELDQQDKQEQKEESKEKRKQNLKIAITSSICTLLIIIILLLLILLGLKNCSKQSGDNTSSSSSSNEPTWAEYDNPKLDDVFKKIVNEYIAFMDEEKSLKGVMMVKYALKEDTKFDLSICVTSNTEEKYVYYYEVENKSYAGFTDPFTFLLDEHTDLFLDETAHFETYKELNTTVSSDKPNRYIVVSNLANTAKYFFGSYQDTAKYEFHIYDKVEYTDGVNPFNNDGEIITTGNLLFGYYHSLYE